MTATNFWLIGNGGFYNRGCEAIFRTTADLISQEFSGARFTAWSSDSETDARESKMGNVRWRADQENGWLWGGRSPWRIVIPAVQRVPPGGLRTAVSRALACPDCVLSLGGDNFSLDYGLPKKFVSQCEYFLRHGIPTAIWSASIGPFSGEPEYEKSVAEFLKRVSLITARESGTVDYLDSIGVRENVVKVHDVAFALEPEPYASPESAFFEGDDIIGINVSGLILKWYANDARAFQCEIVAFIEMLLGKGYRVALIPHVSKPGAPMALNDHAFLREIRGQISAGEDRVLLLPDGIPTRQLKWAISRCRIFFGARTHATIAAISSGVPTIAIAYSAKARGIWNDVFESTDYLLDTDKVSAHMLTEKFELVLSDERAIRETLSSKKAIMRQGAKKNALALRELLANH